MSDKWKWHKGWGSSPTWTPETHCNDGASGLTAAQEVVFNQALDIARREGEGHAEAGQIRVTVNMNAGHSHDVARYAIWENDALVTAGKLAAARKPLVEARQRRVFHWQLPDLHITVPAKG